MSDEAQGSAEKALERFERALAKVEEAFASEREAADGLRRENERLKRALAQLRARGEALAAANRQALGRLDNAMKTLRRLLGDDRDAA